MPLPSSGQITLDQMHVEVGGTSGTQASINDSDIRSMIGASSGQANLSFSDFYGASSGVTINITISSNTNNYNLWTNKGGTYSAGNTTVNVTINSGVTISSTSTDYAFTTGLGWVTGDVINITNNGTIKGKGGNGGAGGNAVYNSSVSNAGNGGTGGPAFRGQFACTVTNNGSVYGGGGGGGGGGSFYGRLTIVKTTTSYAQGGGGGGGGAGVIAGSGGSGGSASGAQSTAQGNTGNAGTATAGGAGGTNAGSGGAGGGLGANGVTGVLVPNNYGPPEAYGNPGTGGVRGYYQVGSVFINGGSGIGGTVGGRSA
jgi:hypothetical protein